MRVTLLIVGFFTLSVCSGQTTTYRSSHTIHFPSNLLEDIQRTITISPEYVLIKSYIHGQHVDDQLLVIKETYETKEGDGVYIIYLCLSPDEIYPSRVIIKKNNPQHITVQQPSSSSNDSEIFELILEVLK